MQRHQADTRRAEQLVARQKDIEANRFTRHEVTNAILSAQAQVRHNVCAALQASADWCVRLSWGGVSLSSLEPPKRVCCVLKRCGSRSTLFWCAYVRRSAFSLIALRADVHATGAAA